MKPGSGLHKRVDPGDITRPLILLVDDCEDSRAMYIHVLRSQFRLAEAANGEEAVEKAIELQPHLVVMDLTLPIVDGWEATRRLRRDERTASIPIIALSGYELSDPALFQHADIQFNASITKPCLPHDLLHTIENTLGHGESITTTA